VIAANRLPCRIADEGGTLQLSPSAGGLVTSMASYLAKTRSKQPTLWVGASDVDEPTMHPHLKDECLPFENYQLVPVFLPPHTQDAFYNGFCNSTIWPLFHYFPSYVRYKQEHFVAYRDANRMFCDRLAAVLRPGDRIWIHDYHLMLLPAMLRERFPKAEIGFFLHIPFPSFEVLRLLPDPWRRALLHGMLGADLVGFHTHAYAQHFKHSVQQVLGYDHQLRTVRTSGQVSVVDAFPISIDTEWFNAMYDAEGVVNERERIRQDISSHRMLFSVDRLDYTKGVLNRLEAYELFLESDPDMLEQVVFVVVVVPSRDVVEKYAELRREIEMQVSRINGRFGRIGWTPVVYRYTDVTVEHLVALYSTADVAVITPIRDGMNLVAKEFVASSADRQGVLILSETAGAAEELSGALLVNPNDRRAIADAMARALSMHAEEQAQRHMSMMHRLKQYDVAKWAQDFLDQLHEARDEQRRMSSRELTPEMEFNLQQAYAGARHRTIFLDHDGTLVPFDRDPSRARPTAEVLRFLEQLTMDPLNHVVIVSGRSPDELEAWFGHLRTSLSAEHGVFFREVNGQWRSLVPETQPWKRQVLPLFRSLADRCPGSLVQEKTASLAWHYRGAPRDLGFLRSRQLMDRLSDLAPQLGFRVTEGDKVVEARPIGTDKGRAVTDVLALGESGFVLALGDDRTDEDMFRALPPSAFSVCIGLRPSLARFNLASQLDVIPFLRRICMIATPEPATADKPAQQ
jgi:trehalose 6-phosphate synthase/phosphatase